LEDRLIKKGTRYNRMVEGSTVPDVDGSNKILLSTKTA
jgi:hypothetical protein